MQEYVALVLLVAVVHNSFFSTDLTLFSLSINIDFTLPQFGSDGQESWGYLIGLDLFCLHC